MTRMVDGWIKENIESFFIFINKTSPWREGKRTGKRDEWTRNEESYKEMAQSTRRHSLRLFLNNNEMQSS